MTPDPVRQSVVVDMAYELGGAGLAGFVHFLAAYRAGQWATAAAEIKNSLLYSQVPRREQENMMILATGEWPRGITCAADLVKRHEGLTLTAKPDAKGKWEIGYGCDIDPPVTGQPVPTCTESEAEAMFSDRFALAESRAEADVGPDYWYAAPTQGNAT